MKYHDIGFAFLPGFTNNGFAFEAVQKVLLDIGNSDHPDHPAHPKILATTITGNARSIKLLEKLGFRFLEEIEVKTEKLLVYEIGGGSTLTSP